MSRRSDFGTGEHGSATIETALTIATLVVAAALLVEIVMGMYERDQMGRAAQAIAQALVLGSSTSPCDLLRRELGFGPEFDCVGEWDITVSRDIRPSEIPTEAASGTGDMVVVRIGTQGSTTGFGVARAEPAP